MKKFTTLAEFYPYYLSEHRNGTCRVLHLCGSTSVLALLVVAILTGNHWLGWLMPLAGYGPAWVGHFFFEKNKPATFQYPGYSLLSDWIMMKDILIGRVPLLGDIPAELRDFAVGTENSA